MSGSGMGGVMDLGGDVVNPDEATSQLSHHH